MKRFVRDNSLSLVMFGLFAVFLIAQSITGFAVYNDDQREHGEATISYPEYLRTGHFVEATFENWESEYLQMAAYVLFTVFLVQRGSSESKDPDKDESVDEDPRQAQDRPDAPWAVRYGGPVLKVYETLTRDRVISVVPDLVRSARDWRCPGVQPGAARPRRPGRLDLGIPAHQRILVPVIPELAERVPGGLFARGAVDLPAPARVSGIQARCRCAQRDRKQLRAERYPGLEAPLHYECDSRTLWAKRSIRS